jgi:hypothetical protein
MGRMAVLSPRPVPRIDELRSVPWARTRSQGQFWLATGLSDNHNLRMPRYRTPTFRYGQRVQCQGRGEVTIVGLTDAPVPWPMGKTKRAKSLVLYRDLAHAVRREANQDVARLFGVTGQTVTKWRRALDVPPNNRGTLRRRVEAGKRNKKGLLAMHAKARDPMRCAKIAAAKRGKPRPRSVIGALRRANLGRKLSAEQRAKMSATHKRRGTRPPKAGRPWEHGKIGCSTRCRRRPWPARRPGRWRLITCAVRRWESTTVGPRGTDESNLCSHH